MLGRKATVLGIGEAGDAIARTSFICQSDAILTRPCSRNRDRQRPYRCRGHGFIAEDTHLACWLL